ncbi:hypothetical protein J6590_023254 [Homalodisca vitripennis]|nr:hypothetical protein J6590_023254 [Homalodisca vitripennis]
MVLDINIFDAFGERCQLNAVMLDFAKAFYYVNHRLLLDKLKCYGFNRRFKRLDSMVLFHVAFYRYIRGDAGVLARSTSGKYLKVCSADSSICGHPTRLQVLGWPLAEVSLLLDLPPLEVRRFNYDVLFLQQLVISELKNSALLERHQVPRPLCQGGGFLELHDEQFHVRIQKHGNAICNNIDLFRYNRSSFKRRLLGFQRAHIVTDLEVAACRTLSDIAQVQVNLQRSRKNSHRLTVTTVRITTQFVPMGY